MKKYNKNIILMLLLVVLLAGAFFVNIDEVQAQPISNKNDSLGRLEKVDCDGATLNAFNFEASYSVTKTGNGMSVRISISAATHKGIKDLANTKADKTVMFQLGREMQEYSIKGNTSGEIAVTFSLDNPKYNTTYNLHAAVFGEHGYIGHSYHYWSMSLSADFRWDKEKPTLSIVGGTSGGATERDVTVTSGSTDASVAHKHNGQIVDTQASDGYKKVVTAEGRHDFTIRNNDDAEGGSNSYYFIIDKTAPTGTLNGVSNGGYTRNNVTFNWADALANQAAITITLNGIVYLKGAVISTEGRHTIVISDAAGNSSTYTFNIDKTKPAGTLNGVSNGGQTSGNVSLGWSDTEETATLNGANYNSGRVISESGNYTLILADKAGNSSTYTFKIDKTRPYITNLDYIKSVFSLSTADSNKLSAGQVGNVDLTLGQALPGLTINLADALSTFSVTLTQSLYQYSYITGGYVTESAKFISLSSNVKISQPGEYILRARDALSNELTLRFTLGVNIAFTLGDFVHKIDRYILGNSAINNIIGYVSLGNLTGATILIDDVNTSLKSLTLGNLKSYLTSKGERDKSARIKLLSNFNGVECIYFDYQIGYDLLDADIHNIDGLEFEGGSGSYLGTAKPGIKLEYGAMASELDETATLVQTLYAYDSRNILYVKEEQTVAYTSGLIISNNGYYVLRINDGVKITEYAFKIMDEFKSANEYALKNEYFIAPEYNQVKLPMSFGTFNISHHENIADTYIGKYSAEKQYLFSATENTAQAFAFAAEFSVCVQKTNSGYLYRARNQGIQVAYNSLEQLSAKIREVVKEYISYKSMKISDTQSIDYNSQVIMDDSLKYNGNYLNVAPQVVAGITYDKVMLINKNFVFKTNAGRDVMSSLAKITITNLETGLVYNIESGATLSSVTELNGLYRVEETCPGSTVTVQYYIYLDNVAPTADIVSSKADGTSIDQTVTAADTIVLQVAEFNLKSVTDMIDNYCMAYISGYGFSDAISIKKGEMKNIRMSAGLGHKGAYTIEIYDRSKNRFTFMLYIMGAAPEATFAKIGSGDTEQVILNISTPDKYCAVMGLSIYRNKTDSNSGELLEDSNNTQISPAVLSYVFKQGGRYAVVIADNYGRTTTIELRYVKDMPNISVEGLNKERRVNKDITVTLPLNCLYTIKTAKNSTISTETMTDTSRDIIVIVIRPRNDYNELVYLEDKVTITAWYEADPDSYNDLSYILDTIAPTLELTLEGGEVAQGTLQKSPVRLRYDNDVKSVDVTRNGKYFSYSQGQLLRLDGEYIAKVNDSAGNVAVREFILDTGVDYTLNYENNKKYQSASESGVVVTKGFWITTNEQIAVTATKDSYQFEYKAIDKILSPGLYSLELTDNAGNIAAIKIRVISSIEGVALRDEDNELLPYNALTRKTVYLEWSADAYMKNVSYRLNAGTYDYSAGDSLTRSGLYVFTLTDVVDNTLEVRVKIDKEVDLTINYDKQYPLDEIGDVANILTKRFNISHGESNILMKINRDDVAIDYKLGTWMISNGQYEITAEDEAGNTFRQYITVVGESQPAISIETISGLNVVDKSVHNEVVTLSWAKSDNIAYVNVNNERVGSDTSISADGKYTVSIVDLLNREVTMTFSMKTKISYEITYVGSHVLVEDDRHIVLTRGFKIASSDSSVSIKATLNGSSINISSYKLYSTAGDYELRLSDNAGNTAELYIRVVDKTFLPKISDTQGKAVANGSVINTGFSIELTEFVQSIKVNSEKYVAGDVIHKEGKSVIEVTDVLGGTATLHNTIDTVVKYILNYGKTYDKQSNILTDKFMLSLNESAEIVVKLNGEVIEYVTKYYIESGMYDIVMTDELENVEQLIIEVDNRTPAVDIANENGELVTSNVTNGQLIISWTETQNIAEVRVNGTIIANGAIFSAVGKYDIVIVNQLGITTSKIINIKHDVEYSVDYRVGSYEYEFCGSTWVLTAGFGVTGSSIMSITCTKDGMAYPIQKGVVISVAGLYIVTMTDNAGNVASLRVQVSDKAISSGVMLGGDNQPGNITTNQVFTIADNQFVSQIKINGEVVAEGVVIDAEGKYDIEYLDVLGRKSYQLVIIDISVKLEWSFKSIKFDDHGRDIYYSTKLTLTAREALTYVVKLNGETVQDFDQAKTCLGNGLYEVVAGDVAGNAMTVWVLVDNVAPIITASLPDTNNNVRISISDSTDVRVEVYLDGSMLLDKAGEEFVLDKHGKYKIVATDEVGNLAELSVNTDMKVDVTYNFLNGQTINFKPTFSASETIAYTLERDGDVVKDYKLSSALSAVGRYTLTLTDEQNNILVVKFDYAGNSRKLAATNYMLPKVEGLEYKVIFNQQTIDVIEKDGYIILDQTGDYELQFTVDGKEQSYYVEIINTPPKVKLTGSFKSKEDLRTSKAVEIDSAADYGIYLGGVKIKHASMVSKVGKYKIIATDEVGNVSEVEFEIYYAANTGTVVLILLLCTTLLLIVMFILKRKGVFKKKAKRIKASQ